MTKLNISLPYTNIVNIDLYDISGRLIDNILYMEMRKCVYEIVYNADSLSPGIYYIVYPSQIGLRFLKKLQTMLRVLCAT